MIATNLNGHDLEPPSAHPQQQQHEEEEGEEEEEEEAEEQQQSPAAKAPRVRSNRELLAIGASQCEFSR